MSDNNLATTGTYQMQFALFDAASGGNQIGATVSNASVQVSDGIFTVNLAGCETLFAGQRLFDRDQCVCRIDTAPAIHVRALCD